MFLWRTLCYWWKIVIPAGLILASGLGYLVWKFHVPKYVASALIMIQSSAPYIAFEKGCQPTRFREFCANPNRVNPRPRRLV